MSYFAKYSQSFLPVAILFLSGCGFGDQPLDGNAGGFRVPYSRHALDSHRFIVFAPESDQLRSSEPLPVFLFMHGFGENGTNGVTQIHNNFGPDIAKMQEFYPFIAVCVQTSNDREWAPGGVQVQQTLKILDQVMAAYNADPDRVILTGVSSGGRGVWTNAADLSGRFAAAVPIAADGSDDRNDAGSEATNAPADPPAESLADARLPMWIMYNAGDFVAEGCRQNREELLTAGLSPMVTEYQQAGHNAWSRSYSNKAMYAWCLEQNRRQRQPRFQWVRGVELVAANAVDGLSSSWEAGEDDSISATHEADSFIAVPGFEEIVEAHFDMWPSPGAVSRIGIFADSTSTQPMFVLQLRDLHTGFSDVIGPDGNWRADVDMTTQQQLTAGEWNDIRLAIDGDRLRLRINGWKAPDLDLGQSMAGYGFRLMPPARGKTAFRYVRYRLEQSDTNGGRP